MQINNIKSGILTKHQDMSIIKGGLQNKRGNVLKVQEYIVTIIKPIYFAISLLNNKHKQRIRENTSLYDSMCDLIIWHCKIASI